MIATNTSISVRRLVTDHDDHSDYSGLDALSDLPCYIEPLSDTPEASFENDAAHLYFQCLDFGAVYDIRIGDRVTDDQGETYIVRGVKKYENNADIPDDMELLLAKKHE